MREENRVQSENEIGIFLDSLEKALRSFANDVCVWEIP